MYFDIWLILLLIVLAFICGAYFGPKLIAKLPGRKS